MQKKSWLAFAVLLAAVVAGLKIYPQSRGAAPGNAAPGGTDFRILLGVNDKAPTTWDGSIAVSGGSITGIRGWRFTAADSADSSSWKAATRNAVQRKGNLGPLVANGVIVTAALDDPNARFDVKTAQGSFSFRAQEVGYFSAKAELDSRVQVDRSPTMTELTTSAEEQDFPAIAQSDDAVYVSYVEFVHADRKMETRRAFEQAPKDFDFLAAPAGGDQVFLLRYSKPAKSWSQPMPVSASKQDVMRTAVAVDGQKRVWVFWSANKSGNFDIYARAYGNGRWSPEIRLTKDPGTDVNPVAATDAKGRVWVAWQGFRNNNLEILAAAQNGDGFGKEAVVSFSKASDWDPSIATASNGEVAVAWDTYDKGDYDVYFRRLRLEGEIRMEAPVAVAATPNFEARSSIAYDPQNRLWVAYEASDSKWGKDFGAYETSGIALYQDHNVRLTCFQGGQALAAASDLTASLPGRGEAATNRKAKKKAVQEPPGTLPDPAIAARRAPSANSQPPQLPMNSFPRIATDPHGAIYLTYRTPVSGISPVGTVWMQNFSYLEGAQWSGPITLPETDGGLDDRAAMAAISPGNLMLVTTTDHRQSTPRGGGKRRPIAEDALTAINADLVAAEFNFPGARSAEVKPAAAAAVASPDPVVGPEREQVALMRGYRTTAGSDKLQLMRGEFHRHTEISVDGGRDGPLIDAYRYMIDAASMDWVGCCDHDNGGGREYFWWQEQKLTDAYKLGRSFVPMFAYERSVRYPEGHRNVVFAQRGIRPLPRLPKLADDAPPGPAPDTQMLYRYLKQFHGIVASHTSGTDMGTDWRDNDPTVEPVVEIYQGDRQNYEMPGAPRTNSANDSIGGWRPLGFVSLALQKGYRLGFQASSDHISTHMSYCNLWVTAPTREAIMEAFHKRRVYGATDLILADVHCGSHFMGEEFSTEQPPAIAVKLTGTANFAKVNIIKDNQYVYTVQPGTKKVDFVWKDNAAVKGKTSYYYVRGEQADGELVWVSPMWITYQ
jgi:hypothetical protein